MRVSVWVAVVCAATGRVLLAKRAPQTRNGGRWNFFGGGIDSGEHPEETALRELREEAGLLSRREDLVYLGDSFTRTKRNMLFVVTAEAEFEPVINHESQDWRWIGLDELLSHRRLHAPTEKLSPLVRHWAAGLPEAPAEAEDLPPPPALAETDPVVPPPASSNRWDWLLRHVAGRRS